MFLSWTDYNAYYVEPCLMSLWLLAGGNVLFGDWGRPEGTQKKVAPPDLEKLAYDAENDSDDETAPTNDQHAFAQLIRDGHYLGYWRSSDERPSQLAFDNVRLAIDYRLLYPRSAEPAAEPRPAGWPGVCEKRAGPCCPASKDGGAREQARRRRMCTAVNFRSRRIDTATDGERM
jgi:hypothetical protein